MNAEIPSRLAPGHSGLVPADRVWVTLVVDEAGKVAQWSPAAVAALGVPTDEALGASATSLLTAESHRAYLARLLSYAVGGHSWSGTVPVRLATGLLRDADYVFHPLPGPWARLIGARSGSLPMSSGGRETLRRKVPAAPAGAAGLWSGPVHGSTELTENAVLVLIGIIQSGASDVPDEGEDDVSDDATWWRTTYERLNLLTETSERVGTTLDLERTAQEALGVLVPRFADLGGVEVHEVLLSRGEVPQAPGPDDAVVMRRIALAGQERIPAMPDAFPIGEVVRYRPSTPWTQCMASGKTIVLDAMGQRDAQEFADNWGRPGVAKGLRDHSIVLIPLAARGRVLGCLVLNRYPDRPRFDALDITLAEEVTARAALCLDNARLYDRERRTALMLQHTLLPQGLSPSLGLEVAHRYRPGSAAAEVGGDWYDVIPLPGGRSALVIGDVMGHDVRAAAVMGQLRTAVRTLASVDLGPVEVLGKLDDIVRSIPGLNFATCVYAVYDPVTRKCTMVRAGHVPPVLVHPDGATEVLDIPPGVPLGVGGVPLHAVELELPIGSILALCTDGLVESRERDIDSGLERLQAELARPTDSLEELADAVLGSVAQKADSDDSALLLVRVRSLAEDVTVSWELPPHPEVVALARHRVREIILAWGFPEVAESVELLTSELVTNALRYGTGPIRLRLLRDKSLLVEVEDSGETEPQLRIAETTDDGGRGLQLVNLIAAHWGTRHTAEGKVVWFELAFAAHD